MCINLANEQLHQLFTKYIFKLEIQECLDEQIELNNSDLITYQDNQIILDLFLEVKNLRFKFVFFWRI
jgi:myosin heavy subunit